MRKVGRRITYRGLTRRAPWTWRPTFVSPPRVCLTHQVDPIYYDAEAVEPLLIGKFDYLLRLYQHRGASPVSVQHSGGIAYFESEWAQIRERHVEWIEFVKQSDGTTFRVDYLSASRYGSWVSTPRGYMWVVPEDQYTLVTS